MSLTFRRISHGVSVLSLIVWQTAGSSRSSWGSRRAQAGAFLVDLLVDQLDVETLVPRELEVLAIDQLLVPEAGKVDVLDGLRDDVVETEELVLARVVGDPALADREVDDVRARCRR